MARVTTVALMGLFLLVHAARGAGEKEASKQQLAGSWKRTVEEHSITFTFKGNTLRVALKAGDNALEVDADYGVSKDGVVFGRISKIKKDGDGPSEGDLFSFRVRVNGNTLTLSDLKTGHESGEAKELLQGEYHKQKEKQK